MKRLFALTLTLSCICAMGQPAVNPDAMEMLRQDPTRSGINTNSYEFHPLSDTPAPKGYKAFYISHYGRHGSRTDWGGREYSALVDILEGAQKDGLLTAEGEGLLNEAIQVRDIHAGMDGRLTMRGVREHKQLARNMYRRYPEVFRKGSRRIRSISSIVPRCIISMNAFTGQLSALQPDLDISYDTGENYMKYIDNYCPKDIWDSATVLVNKLRSSYVPDTVWVMSHLFTDPTAARAHVRNALALEYMIYSVARMQDSGDIETDIFRHLPADAIYKFWDESNRDLFIHQGNSVEFGRRRLENVEPSIRDFVEKADEAIASGQWCADLRFGHDFPLTAIASYLGIEGVGDRLSFDEIPFSWNGALHIPFAANLQLIFYRNKSGDVLVKFLFNEREVLLRGLTPVSGPYYRWNEIKNDLKGYLR